MAQKRNKRRNTARKKNNDGILGPLIGLLFGSSTVALLLLVVLFAQTLGKSSNQNGIQQGNGSGKHHSADEEYINIDADSFRGYVGQSYTLSLSANPVDLVEAVIWSSSNEASVIVDEKGRVVLVGEGVAAVTATAGQYSSAIAIEVVKDSTAQGDMGFNTIGWNDKYTQNNSAASQTRTDSGETTQNNVIPNGNPGGNDSTEPVTEPAGSDYSDDGNNTRENETTQPPQNNEPAQPPQNNEPAQPSGNGTENSTENTSHEETTEETTTEFIPPTTKAAEAIDTQEMFSVLSQSGFSQYLPNAAIYDVDGEYYGEVIVQSDSVHIYIKKRSGEFDMAVRGALAYLLPETSESVWNVYTTLSKDKTINSDGRKVRFVMAAANAHSQIIVYNP